MQYKYYTKSGSVYIRTVDAYGDTWDRQDKAGRPIPLAGAVHLTRRRLQELITDYPVNVLDRTALMSRSVAREFFDDVKREEKKPIPQGEESLIFFLLDLGDGKYSIGYSSPVERVEIREQTEKPEGAKIRY